MLAHFTIQAKILLQKIWAAGLDWDDTPATDLEVKGYKWFSELNDLANIKIPRCLQLPSEKDKLLTLHTFVDASQEAYCAVTYARYAYDDGSVHSQIVAAKTRVAPLKATSIPRLELMGAILGLRLATASSRALETELKQSTFWSDSMDVLWWVRGRSRHFKPFVAHRIGEIQNSTSPDQWRHVPTKDNPADIATRGVQASNLVDNKMWWNGPDFLCKEEVYWPKNTKVSEKSTTETRRGVQHTGKVHLQNNCTPECQSYMSIAEKDANWRLDPIHFSCWKRLKRITAWVYRFLENCQPNQRSTGELLPEELENAEIRIIRKMQMQAFSQEYSSLANGKKLPKSSKLLVLQPRLDSDGLIRCDGRLKYADCLPYHTRFPIILPRKHWVTRLIVKFYHEEGKHAAGTNQTLSAISTRYWIISAREEIREWEKKCNECERRKAKAAEQIMAPLPEIRLKKSLRAFAYTGTDFAGPFITVQGRGKRREKRYLCLFTCLGTRAVHLEIAFGLDTDSFLNAFYRRRTGEVFHVK
ncbi:uncharacterized protein [Ptychodera flava]|uniref:uncharacterized protein n=1 Tax=Ptychodera flava TaxID=63121 RepID=UPI00396A343F